MKYLIIYLIIMNAAAFALMLIDKKKAQKGAWRISEATLMTVAVIGGSIGAIAGMRVFRHKTKHPKFYIGLPAILAVHIAIAAAIIYIL